MNKKFDIQYTKLLKGGGILLLFLHHILNNSYSYVSILPRSILLHLVSLGKICVGIFFILSGYGMYSSFLHKQGKSCWDDFKFVGKHVIKLFFSYWIIFLVFVPISIFFGYNCVEVYSRTGNFIVNILSEIMGMAFLFSTPSMNNTWWYLDVTIVFYCISPLLFRLTQKRRKITNILFITLFLLSLCYYDPKGLIIYFIPYFFGAIMARDCLIERAVNDSKKYDIVRQILLAIIFFSVVLYREIVLREDVKFYKLDWILAAILIYFCFYYISVNSKLGNLLIRLGEQSGNIFLFHSFLYAFWLKDLIYGKLKIGIIIYLFFLIVCYWISMGLEWFKEKLKINYLTDTIIKSGRKVTALFGVIIFFVCISCLPKVIAFMAIGTVRLETKETPIQVGASRRINVKYNTVFDELMIPVWESSKPDIAKVSYDGIITGIQKGEAVISCKVGIKEVEYKIIVN